MAKMKIKKKVETESPFPASGMTDWGYRILVCGSRDWADGNVILRELSKVIVASGRHYKDVCIITGGADGADSLVAELCQQELGIACAVFTAAWKFHDKLGRKREAGPIRNGWMLRWGRPHYVLAFHPYLPGSRGTKNMVEQARRKGVPVKVIER